MKIKKMEKNNSITRNFTKKVLSIIGLTVVLLLIIGGAALAGKVWNPPWNPFSHN